MQDVHNILLYCNTDVAVIKPVSGRASIYSASLDTTRLIALGFHTEKEVCQHFILCRAIYCSVLCVLCELELDHCNVNILIC